MSVDGQSLAGVKNRITKSQLDSELYRIEREQKAEIRMHNTSKQRFRAKYSKLDFYTDRGKDAADVRLYETHTPGFCYRRNGECRIPQISSTSGSVDFEDIHSLLFTEGEVDIEKVLCLHLLTAHKTETLTPPSRYHRAISFLAKEQSPLERLIERSRKKRQEDSVTKLLPTYVLDVKTNKPGETESKDNDDVPIRDGRLAARVIINDKIVQLVHTVMSALETTNPSKVNEFLTIAKDPEAIKGIVEKPHIQEFLNNLNGQMIVTSCESFHLTQPFRAVTVPLELRTSSAGLENLVSHIRKNVLQSPAQSTWKDMYNKSQSRGEEESASHVTEHKNPKKDTVSTVSKETTSENEDVQSKKNFINKNKENIGKRLKPTGSTNKASKSITPRQSFNKSNTFKNPNAKRKHPSYLDFLQTESEIIRTTFPYQRLDDDDNESKSIKNETSRNEVIISNAQLFKGMDIRSVSRIISNKVNSALKRDLESLKEEVEEDTEKSSKSKDVSASQTDTKPVKTSIKQTTCAACVEKWRNPLPKPKISKLRKVYVPTLDQNTYNEFKAGSAQKLSQMIDEEMKKLKADEVRKASRAHRNSNVPSNRAYKNMARGNFIRRHSVDSVELDLLDLARIAQEIKERETQKKLSKFLETKI